MSQQLGLDGVEEVGYPEGGQTCPPAICNITRKQLECTFVNLLPSGPLWDRCKSMYFQEGVVEGSSLVAVAVYLAQVFDDILKNGMWPAIRESYPWTSATTLTDWLDRMKWVDCYGLCRNPDIANLSPLEVMGICGPEHCDIKFSEEYQRAYDYAILQSLHRLMLRPLRTLHALNAILDPLGVSAIPGKPNKPVEEACDTDEICITLKVTRDTIYLPNVECGVPKRHIPSALDMGCDAPMGLPTTIYPTALAAECITRAFLPRNKLCIVNLYCTD